MKKNRCLWPLVLAALIVGCDSQPSKEAADKAAIALFERLALPVIGLRFPYSRDHLETCRRVRDEQCVGTYDSFREAKDQLLAMPRRDALELTLAWFGDACRAAQSAKLGFVCFGAVIALASFTEEPEDERIRQFLSQLPPAQRDSLIDQSISIAVSWFDNRAHRQAWRSWLGSQIEDQAVRSNALARLDSPDARSHSLYELVLNGEVE